MTVREALAAERGLAGALADPAPPALLAPLVSPPLAPEQSDGLDLILEGFLLHHGRPRHLVPADRGAAVLAGDYCYAQGLIRIAAGGDLFHIRALADLIAMSAGLVAAGERLALPPLWRATAGAMSRRGGPDAAAAGDDYRAGCALLRAGDVTGGLRRLRRLEDGLTPTPALTEVLA